MDFYEYMKMLPSPRNKVIDAIAKRCMVSNVTVYRWAQLKAKPNALCRSLISQVLAKPEDELFPGGDYGVDRIL